MPPRSRESDPAAAGQRPARAPLHLRMTAGAEANGVRHRAAGSPKPDERRSPRSCSPLAEKKKAGTKVAELETKLGRVQEELKKLREQLATAEAAKKDAQVALEEAKKRVGKSSSSPSSPASAPAAIVEQINAGGIEKEEPAVAEVKAEEEEIAVAVATDVFEICVVAEDHRPEITDGEDGAKQDDIVSWTCEEVIEKMIEEAKENADVAELKEKLMEKEKEMEAMKAENAALKKAAADAEEALRVKEEAAAAKASALEKELTASREREGKMAAELSAANAAKEALEAEMRRLRVQTDQWRKAAEAAAAALTDRPGVGVGGQWQEWDLADDGEDFAGGKRRSAGIRIIGDLWKKKGQQK